MLFDRLNNAFVHRLTLSFCQENLHLLHYLRANANVLKCEVGLLSIGDTSKAIDYALVDFLGAHLKPSTYETLMFHGLREDYAMFFARDAWRGNVKHLTYIVSQYPTNGGVVNTKN